MEWEIIKKGLVLHYEHIRYEVINVTKEEVEYTMKMRGCGIKTAKMSFEDFKDFCEHVRVTTSRYKIFYANDKSYEVCIPDYVYDIVEEYFDKKMIYELIENFELEDYVVNNFDYFEEEFKELLNE